MSDGEGLDARETTAALRLRSPGRLQEGFARLVAAEARAKGWDPRDTMISLAPLLDCARRLDQDPAALLGPIAGTGPDWFAAAFDAFVRRNDVGLPDFGWSLVDTPDGPAYRFAWPGWTQPARERPGQAPDQS